METICKKTDGEPIKMLHLLYQIDLGQINTDNLAIEDEFGHKWIYSTEFADFIQKNSAQDLITPQYKFFQEYWGGDKCMDFLDIKVIILKDNITLNDTVDNSDTIAYMKAKNNVTKVIEKLYMDLNMEIDNCQGCMDDLDVAFKELSIYSEILQKICNIDVEKDHGRMYTEWCDNYKKEQVKREKELNPIFNKFKFNALDMIEMNDTSKLAKIVLDFLMDYNINIDTLNTQEKLLQEKLKNM